MHISFATANLFYHPFDETLELIAEAGFDAIELDLFWERKEWAMAQHLRDIPVDQVVRSVQRSGLRVTSIHDGGGVLEDENSATGFINPALNEYIERLGYAPDCLVFHTPHIEGQAGDRWWERLAPKLVAALEPYRRACLHVTIENMPTFEGYTVPLVTPEQLAAFTRAYGLGVTLDTTHYAQIGTNVLAAAATLDGLVRTVHLSDYAAPRTHVFIGEGELNLGQVVQQIDPQRLNALTLECSLALPNQPGSALSRADRVARIRLARTRAEALCNPNAPVA